MIVEQGRLLYGDLKCVISGTIQTTSGARVFTLSKSGADLVYEQILPGIHTPSYYGENAYKLIYLRNLTLGSLT